MASGCIASWRPRASRAWADPCTSAPSCRHGGAENGQKRPPANEARAGRCRWPQAPAGSAAGRCKTQRNDLSTKRRPSARVSAGGLRGSGAQALARIAGRPNADEPLGSPDPTAVGRHPLFEDRHRGDPHASLLEPRGIEVGTPRASLLDRRGLDLILRACRMVGLKPESRPQEGSQPEP